MTILDTLWGSFSIPSALVLSFILIGTFWLFSQEARTPRPPEVRSSEGPLSYKDLISYINGFPIIGPLMIWTTINYRRSFTRRFGNIVQYVLLGRSTISIAGEENVRTMLKGENKLVISNWPTHFIQLLGSNAVAMVSDTEKHKRLHTILSKAVNPSILAANYPTLLLSFKQLFLDLTELTKNGCINPSMKLREFAYSLIMLFVLGSDELEKESMNQHFHDFESLTRGLIDSTSIRLPFTIFGQAMNARDRIIATCLSIIRKRRLLIAKNGGNVNKDGLTMMLEGTDEHGSKLTDEEIADQMVIFIFAGHDTTFSALSSTLYVMSSVATTEQLSKLKEEVESIDYDSLNLQTLNSMQYLDAFVKEILRLYSPIAEVSRQALTDITLNYVPGTESRAKSQPILIPKGADLSYSIAGTHNEEENYPSPEKFDPDRFYIHKLDKNHPNSFMTFGYGPRMCLGINFAKLELKTFVFELIKNYKVVSEGKPKFISIPIVMVQSRVQITPLEKKE